MEGGLASCRLTLSLGGGRSRRKRECENGEDKGMEDTSYP